MIPAARNTALRSQPMPNNNSNVPMMSLSQWTGTRSSSGPSATTITTSTARAAAVPAIAARQPRSVPVARTMVNASTTSTSEARKAALTAGAAVANEIMKPLRIVSKADTVVSSPQVFETRHR